MSNIKSKLNETEYYGHWLAMSNSNLLENSNNSKHFQDSK